MACEQLTKDQLNAQFRILPKDFSYVHGEWCKPTPTKETAELLVAREVEATGKFNAEVLKAKVVSIMVGVSKPLDNFGWENAGLTISAEIGNERVMRNINSIYLNMTPGGHEMYFPMPLLHVFDGPDKEIRITLSDSTKHAKAGLVFYGAYVSEPNNA